jgi:hypothetical protein
VVAICLGPELGDLRGRGLVVARSRTQHARLSALTASLTLDYGIGPSTKLTLGVEGGRLFETPTFGVLADGEPVEIFTPSPWLGRVFLGFGVL